VAKRSCSDLNPFGSGNFRKRFNVLRLGFATAALRGTQIEIPSVAF